jgi:hypothetical protein
MKFDQSISVNPCKHFALVDAGEIDEAIQPLPLSLSNGQTSL